MGRSKGDFRITIPQNFICTGIAGCVAKSATAPLDVIKIRTQVGTFDTRKGFLQAVSRIKGQESITAFWKGNLLGCIRLLPFSVLQFLAFQRLKLILGDSYGRLTVTSAFAAGSTAGLLATTVLYPTDLVKTRLIIQKHNDNYKGIAHAFKSIYRTEGYFAFYRGLSTSLLGAVPFAGATFMTYELLDEMYGNFQIKPTPANNFINGCLAAAFAQTVSFPFDTIRKKMQARSTKLLNQGGVDIHFEGMVTAFRETIKRYGILGLWRGTLPNLLRIVPYTGLTFLTYEQCKKVALYQNGYTLSPIRDDPHPIIDQSLHYDELDDYFEEVQVSGVPIQVSEEETDEYFVELEQP